MDLAQQRLGHDERSLGAEARAAHARGADVHLTAEAVEAALALDHDWRVVAAGSVACGWVAG